LRSEEIKPVSCKNEQEFSLSGAVTIELIQAAFIKDALFRFKVNGFSMSPFIQDGDIVTLSPVSRSPISLGKAVACISPVHKRLVIHRVIGKKGDHYLIKGDNIPRADCLMDKKYILGCVTAIERKNKTVLLGLGPERIVIAFLSRKGFRPLILSFWRLIPKSLRGLIKCRILS